MDSNKLIELANKQHKINPLVVQIHTHNFESKEGISKVKKEPYKISTQIAYLHTEKSLYPREFQINLDDHKPIGIGYYVLDLSKSIEFDGFGSMILNSRNLSLLPIVDF